MPTATEPARKPRRVLIASSTAGLVWQDVQKGLAPFHGASRMMAPPDANAAGGTTCIIIAFPTRLAAPRPAQAEIVRAPGWSDELGMPAALLLATLIVLGLCCLCLWLLAWSAPHPADAAGAPRVAVGSRSVTAVPHLR